MARPDHIKWTPDSAEIGPDFAWLGFCVILLLQSQKRVVLSPCIRVLQYIIICRLNKDLVPLALKVDHEQKINPFFHSSVKSGYDWLSIDCRKKRYVDAKREFSGRI